MALMIQTLGTQGVIQRAGIIIPLTWRDLEVVEAVVMGIILRVCQEVPVNIMLCKDLLVPCILEDTPHLTEELEEVDSVDAQAHIHTPTLVDTLEVEDTTLPRTTTSCLHSESTAGKCLEFM